MLPAETFGTTKHILTISLAKPRYSAKAIKNKEINKFFYGHIHYVGNVTVK
jgi:hypothetical protein